MTKAINSLERLAILVVGVVSIIFVYGMLSMALAKPIPGPDPYDWINSLDMTEQPTFSQRDVERPESAYPEFESNQETTDDTQTVWLLYLTVGPQPTGVAHPHVHGQFATKEECEWLGRHATRSLRRTEGRGTTFYCASESKHGQ